MQRLLERATNSTAQDQREELMQAMEQNYTALQARS